MELRHSRLNSATGRRRGPSVILGIAVVGAWTLAASAAEAQGFGIKGGVSLAEAVGIMELDARTGVPFDRNTGFTAGVYGLLLTAGDTVGFQLEANYVRRNTTADLARLGDAFAGAVIELDTEYLEVPLLLKLYTGRSAAGVRFSIYAGGSVAYVLHAKTIERFPDSVEETVVTDELEKFDVGFPVGISFNIGQLALDGRYTMGLGRLEHAGEGVDSRWRTFTFTLGFTL